MPKKGLSSFSLALLIPLIKNPIGLNQQLRQIHSFLIYQNIALNCKSHQLLLEIL